MTITSADKDFDNLTFTLVADFDAPAERVWQLWADPRQLERWWGPPTHPATVEEHDLTPGGDVTYFMTGPEGDKTRDSREHMEQQVNLGMTEGLQQAVSQMDALLAA